MRLDEMMIFGHDSSSIPRPLKVNRALGHAQDGGCMPTADYPFDHVTHGPYHVVMPLVIAAMTAAAAQDEDVEAEHLVLALAENVELPDDAHQVPEVAMEAAGEIERADELAEANTQWEEWAS